MQYNLAVVFLDVKKQIFKKNMQTNLCISLDGLVSWMFNRYLPGPSDTSSPTR